MTTSTQDSQTDPDFRNKLQKQLSRNKPFSLLPQEKLNDWLLDAQHIRFKTGELMLRPDELSERIFIVIKGTVRLVVISNTTEGQISLDRRGSGQLLGWVGLLRGKPCEYVLASTDVLVLGLSASGFINLIQTCQEFNDYFQTLVSPQEAYTVALSFAESTPKHESEWRSKLLEQIAKAKTTSLNAINQNELPPLEEDWNWHMSTPNVPNNPTGKIITNDLLPLPPIEGYKLDYRLIALPVIQEKNTENKELISTISNIDRDINPVDLEQLGILENDLLDIEDRFPIIKGQGLVQEPLAICEMAALYQQVPFRKDNIKKMIEEQIRRGKEISIEVIGFLCESLGMKCQLGQADGQFIASVESPAILILEGIPVVFYGMIKGQAIIANPTQGLLKIPLEEIQSRLGEKFVFVLPRRVATTPTTRFGWSWFVPLLKKYKASLILVFASSLLAQVFALAIPLLLQQIIDKVLTQGNLSSLNVLGTAMLVMALFQGILQALRTYIFVDTTDRMDLTLGTAVIDRLLALPLSFFEKRPVGELSQRLGELNTIRGFLTGTALITVLNLIFAVIYLGVMLVYSPLLTAVALSTFPLYILLVFGVSPIYKFLIRQRAIAQAKTQSHLIEVLGGIQTVKAQHFELTARWKWQDRYRDFVTEGFKSTALGSTAGEIGAFLNTVSGLLVLWVGMYLVLKGEFTLGMLIAFRIIAGNVTGPLLQLAGLYQGFQKVALSMERLSDIVDQNPELQNPDEIGQISLPAIEGNVRFENVKFRFGDRGPYQLDDVSVEINRGNFVGIVGQSGSGKSTLMKLLPKLYKPEAGRIFIDDYDIGKVDLSSLRRQVGIVPQDSLLFEGTVAENIALNDPQATTEAIIESAKIACAHEFIMTLGQGYATPIAERGANLSGGQRQRIAIARTILSNPQLLVMDEATSALDYDTERQLCLNLQDWANKRTVFFITHRLSTIRNSDLILVMHQGRLVEKGNHESLNKEGGRYATLYKQQESN